MLQPEVSYSNKGKIFLKLSNSLLEQKKLTFEYRKLINMYLVVYLNDWPINPSNNFITRKSLFSAFELTKNSYKK